MSVTLVKEAWKRIERWCKANDPQSLRDLNPGASKKQIRDLEAAIQQPLPEDVRTSLSIHNGQHPKYNSSFFIGNLRLYRCEEIAQEYSGWRESGLPNELADDLGYRFFPPDAIRHHLYDDGWIPILTEDGCGNFLAVDLAPGPTGTVGQIIDFGADIRSPGVLAQSWGAYLTSYADILDDLTEISQGPDDLHEAFHRICPVGFLDGMVRWAKDGRWPIVKFSSTWRTESVMALAKTISKTRDFSVMPILADALEESGCDVAAVLNHCRDPKCKHAKGCWVIDTLVSGKFSTARLCYSD